MKPVFQRGESDCLRACIASIFEIPWQDAPDTGRAEGEVDEHGRTVSQHNTVNAWLKARGLVEWTLNMDGESPVLRQGMMIHRDGSRTPADYVWPYPVATYYVGGGTSPREVGHAVVMFAGKIVHDPHPAQDMTIGPHDERGFVADRPQLRDARRAARPVHRLPLAWVEGHGARDPRGVSARDTDAGLHGGQPAAGHRRARHGGRGVSAWVAEGRG